MKRARKRSEIVDWPEGGIFHTWLSRRYRKRDFLTKDQGLIKTLPWERAYPDCYRCVKYFDDHYTGYEDYNGIGLLIPAIISAMLIALLAVVYTLIRSWPIIPGDWPIVIIIALLIMMGVFALWFLYYSHIETMLTIIENRIKGYDQVWPGIVKLAIRKINEDDDSMQPESALSRKRKGRR